MPRPRIVPVEPEVGRSYEVALTDPVLQRPIPYIRRAIAIHAHARGSRVLLQRADKPDDVVTLPLEKFRRTAKEVA